MEELIKLRQQGSIIDYHEEFDSIVVRLSLLKECKLSYFLGGLKQDVQMMVCMFQLVFVQRAFSLEKLHESNTHSTPSSKPFPKPFTCPCQHASYTA